MARSRRPIVLDSFEQQVEESLREYVPAPPQDKNRILESVAKTRTISLRINERVLERLKRKAAQEGLPYQTLIASVLHRFSTDRLIDESAIRRALAALK